MFMMVIAHAHERCFLLQEELDFRLYEAVLLFAGTQQSDIEPLEVGQLLSALTEYDLQLWRFLKTFPAPGLE